MIDVRTSPDKMFSIVSGENSAGDLECICGMPKTKKLIGQLEEVATVWIPSPTHIAHIGRRTPNMLELRRGLTGSGRTTPFIALKIDAHIR